jgi:hypothetical protein
MVTSRDCTFWGPERLWDRLDERDGSVLKIESRILQLRWSQKINVVTRGFDMAARLRRESDERQLREEKVAEEQITISKLTKHYRQADVMSQNADHHRTDRELMIHISDSYSP